MDTSPGAQMSAAPGWSIGWFVVRAWVTEGLRPGIADVQVQLTNSDDTVGVLTGSTLTYTGGGSWSATTQFDPLAAGTTTIGLTQPSGFAQPTNGRSSIVATVNP